MAVLLPQALERICSSPLERLAMLALLGLSPCHSGLCLPSVCIPSLSLVRTVVMVFRVHLGSSGYVLM